MRLNKFIAQATGLSRRAADAAVSENRVLVNGLAPSNGYDVTEADKVTLDGSRIALGKNNITIMLNKPVGYVCSREGQGNKTIYELIPPDLHHLKSVGRLDKHSSGLLLMTNDGSLAHQLTHPSFNKSKIYKIAVNRPLAAADHDKVMGPGVILEDGVSKLQLERINNSDDSNWKVIMHEGRNRQIRRTFEALGYNVVKLHRTHFGKYVLDNLTPGKYKTV
jgi:23S rRNA pseudouridine2605 synthase